MLDIKFVRENPDIVKENIRKKFQNAKLPLVDEAIALDAQRRAGHRRRRVPEGRAQQAVQGQIGPLFGKAEEVHRRDGKGRHSGPDRRQQRRRQGRR